MNTRYLSIKEKSQIETLYKSGMTTYDIAKILSRSSTTIQRFLNKKGFDLKSNGYKRRIQKYNIDISSFENVEFSDYWAGFIAADGCIYQNGKGQNRLIINISSKDRNHLKKFDLGYPVKVTKRDSCVIDIPSDEICDLLWKRYGISSNKTFDLKYPNNLINDNHFIRGYFDGDGGFSLRNKKYLRAYMIGNFDFISVLQTKLDCQSAIHSIKNSKMVNLFISQKPFEMLKFTEFIYDNSNIFLERKKEMIKYLRMDKIQI